VNPVNASRSSTYSGVIAGDGGLTKIGAPTETLLGANTYNGPTTVSIGKLITTSASTGAGNYSIADSATLGVLAIGAGGSLNVADLTFGNSSSNEFDFAELGYPATKMENVTNTLTLNSDVYVIAKGF